MVLANRTASASEWNPHRLKSVLLQPKRASTSRFYRDAARVLATGRWRSHQKILRKGGGPCPGFRKAFHEGFGRRNSMSFRFQDLRLLAGWRRTLLFVVIGVVRVNPT
jgi:hypothetical protein